MTRPTDLLATDTSARLHARAVAVQERLRGFEARVLFRFRALSCWDKRRCRVTLLPGAEPRLACECGAPPSDLIDLVRRTLRCDFDQACARLEAVADEIDREAARAAGQGELF